MPQCLHLLIVDRARRAALACRCDRRWLLPVLISRERVRVDPLIARWLAQEGLVGNVAGHWLGRLTPAEDGVDWLVAIDALPGARVRSEMLVWTALDVLASSPSVLDYQRWAVSTSLRLGSLPSVVGPFGRLSWIDEVTSWISVVTGTRNPGATTTYRAGSYEVVLGAEAGGHRVYFKGLPPERELEIRLTNALSNLVPHTFARTLAVERRQDASVWWLMSECGGCDLVGRSNPALAADVGRALARVQRLADASSIGRQLECFDLPGAAAWATELAEEDTAGTFERASASVLSAGAPRTWIPLDLDPANVLVDGNGNVSFIDLDDSFVGPAPLAMAMFARRSRNRSGYAPYEKAWSPQLGLDWRWFELAAAVADAWLGWKRVLKKVERGEVHGVLDVARQQLARSLRTAATREPYPRRISRG